jgi:hypothetical protein
MTGRIRQIERIHSPHGVSNPRPSSLDRMNDELERMWKEMILVQFRTVLCHFPGGAQ